MNTEEKLRLRFKNNSKINLFDSVLQDLKPEELKLKLKDLLDEEVDEKYFLKPEQVEKIMAKGSMRNRMMQKKDVSDTLLSRDYKDPKCIELTKGVSDAQRIYDSEGCAKTLKGLGGGQGAKTGLYAVGCAVRAFPRTGSNDENRVQRLELNGKEEANSITNVQKDSMVFVYDDYNSKIKKDSDVACTLTRNSGSKAERNGQKLIFKEPTCLDLYNKKERTDYSITLTEPHHNNLRLGVGTKVRRLTPKECFRLQGFLEDKINLEGLSDTQCYKLAGNGQSVNVVKKIFKELLCSN